MKSQMLIYVRQRPGGGTPIGRWKTLWIGLGFAVTFVLILGTVLIVGAMAALLIGSVLIFVLGAKIAFAAIKSMWRP